MEVVGADPGSDGGPVVAFDAATGSLTIEDPAPGQPVRYTVISAVPAVTAAQLQEAPLPSSSAFAPAIALPAGLPDSLGTVADEAMGRAATPFQQLAALESWLRSNGELDLDAPGGNSYGALERFLAPEARRVATADPSGAPPGTAPSGPVTGTPPRVGTPQQFAIAFAVLARTRGLPSRVVIGYRTDVAAGGTTSIVRGDTAVWPEAYLDGIGWMPFDPIPVTGSAPAQPEQPKVDEVVQAKTDAAARAELARPVDPAGQQPHRRGRGR